MRVRVNLAASVLKGREQSVAKAGDVNTFGPAPRVNNERRDEKEIVHL